MVACGEVDAVIVIFIPPLATDPADVAAAIRDAVGRRAEPVPLLAVFMSAAGEPPAAS